MQLPFEEKNYVFFHLKKIDVVFCLEKKIKVVFHLKKKIKVVFWVVVSGRFVSMGTVIIELPQLKLLIGAELCKKDVIIKHNISLFQRKYKNSHILYS